MASRPQLFEMIPEFAEGSYRIETTFFDVTRFDFFAVQNRSRERRFDKKPERRTKRTENQQYGVTHA
jgi:hypothetical protein